MDKHARCAVNRCATLGGADGEARGRPCRPGADQHPRGGRLPLVDAAIAADEVDPAAANGTTSRVRSWTSRPWCWSRTRALTRRSSPRAAKGSIWGS